MRIERGSLVSWVSEDRDPSSLPMLVIRGPREGYIIKKGLTEIIIVVDLFAEGEIFSNVPLSEISPWVIERKRE